jgi:hypothetical protein
LHRQRQKSIGFDRLLSSTKQVPFAVGSDTAEFGRFEDELDGWHGDPSENTPSLVTSAIQRNNMSTTVLMIGWKLALALLAGSSVLTSLGVWVLARFTSVFDAYSGERAKLLAQFHNLSRLVQQTEKLAATTEAIRAQVSDALWDRQRRWEMKRDIYVKLLEVMGELQLSLMSTWKCRTEIEEARKHPDQAAVKDYLDELKKRAMDAVTAHTAHSATFIRLYNVAPIVISEEACQVLAEIAMECKSGPTSAEQYDRTREALNDGSGRFADVAAKDLGFATDHGREKAESSK